MSHQDEWFRPKPLMEAGRKHEVGREILGTIEGFKALGLGFRVWGRSSQSFPQLVECWSLQNCDPTPSKPKTLKSRTLVSYF